MRATITTKCPVAKRYRKLIDLDEDTKYTLSHVALERGMNLKNCIETLLIEISETLEDHRLGEFSKEREGILNDEEKSDFFNRLKSLR